MLVSFFFFKQKTAYEMRISDWSSDVCSSDLPHQLSFQKGKNMNSPITGKPMKLIREADTPTFRKESFNIVYHYYLCEDSGERFTDDRLDTLNTVQATNQYREKYGIPFPEDIRQIREQYGVSAAKMSEILGLGANAYRLYEAGEMPTVANGRLILSVREPEEFIKQIGRAHVGTPITNSHLLFRHLLEQK